jgi:hypothetical protein
MRSRLSALFLIVCAALPATSCRWGDSPREWNGTQIRADLTTLATRLDQTPNAEGLELLYETRGLSQESLEFLTLEGLPVRLVLPPRFEIPYQSMKSRLSHRPSGVAPPGGFEVLPDEVRSAPHDTPVLEHDVLLRAWQGLRQARSSADIAYLEGDPEGRSRRAVYCSQHCACIVERLASAWAREPALGTHLFEVRMFHASEAGFGVRIEPARPHDPSRVMWVYHAALWVASDQQTWSAIDPIVFGDAAPRPLSEWMGRFENPSRLIFLAYPR